MELLYFFIIGIFLTLFFIAFNYYFLSPEVFWLTLLILSVWWFIVGIKINLEDKPKIKVGLISGIVLMLIDLAMNYQGMIFGLYSITPTTFNILAEPIELPFVAFFGGTALSFFIPRKIKFWHLIFAALLISFIGATVEIFLNEYGVMTYYTVDYLDAFFTYFLVFGIFFILNYILFKKFKR
jgi:hypothetical protein